MTERSVTHATFVVERSYPVAPARVFAAWSDPLQKARWFGGPEEGSSDPGGFDFQVGGQEWSSGTLPSGQRFGYEAHFQDIVPEQRIVYSYTMQLDDARISVSLATIEIVPEGGGARLIVTEQGAYLDGLESPVQREQGIARLLDKLGATLGEA